MKLVIEAHHSIPSPLKDLNFTGPATSKGMYQVEVNDYFPIFGTWYAISLKGPGSTKKTKDLQFAVEKYMEAQIYHPNVRIWNVSCKCVILRCELPTELFTLGILI
jgi:hypothetical protein